MAYNNNFFTPNAPYWAQNPIQPQIQQNQSNIIWVQGEAGGKAFPQGVNCNTILMDSEDNIFYIKTTDASGMPQLRKFAYQEITDSPQNNQMSQQNAPEYVTREEFERRISELNRSHYNNNNNKNRREDKSNE